MTPAHRRESHNGPQIIPNATHARRSSDRLRVGLRLVPVRGDAVSRLVIMSGRLATDFGAGLTVGLLAGTAVGATLASFLFFYGWAN